MYSDYDVIFILDACRYDVFSDVIKNTGLKGDLKKYNTGTSTTFEWYKRYWNKPNDFHLVSDNPQPFHKNSGLAYKNFKSANMSFTSSWLNVEPEKTIQMGSKFDKVLIHLLPPHLPFVFGEGGKFCRQFTSKNIYWQVQEWGRRNGFEKIRLYYKEQVVGILKLIEDNLHLFSGRILITADHGELLGEQNHYDHPPNAGEWQKPFLYEVPFFEVNVTETLIQKRLEMLGYIM